MAADGRDQRRYARYGLQLAATLVHGKRVWHLQTDDVSAGGLFLRVDDPPGLRQLVKISLELPDGGSLDTHAMVVWRRPRKDDAAPNTVPGIGLQFFALEATDGKRWKAFIRDVREFTGQPPSGPKSDVTLPESERRRYSRHPAVFEVRPTNSDALMTLFTRDISVGGMFVSTSQTAPVGTELAIDLVQLDIEEEFKVSAVVRRVCPGDGLGIEFMGLDRVRRAALSHFIRSGLRELV